MTTLHLRQDAPTDRGYPIRLTLKRQSQPDLEAEAKVHFALTQQEQQDLRWYLEDYLQRVSAGAEVTARQVEALMKSRGEELYNKVLAVNGDTQAIWYSIRNDLANLRVEIATGVAEAASIPWELMRDPKMDSPISLRVKSFVRVQSNPNLSFVSVPLAKDGRVRLLYVACRPGGARDVELRAVANRLLHDLGENRERFDIKALRPPTFEQLQKELIDAKEADNAFHIVHFDGHGIYADLSDTSLADWVSTLSSLTLGSRNSGRCGYLLFEHPSEMKTRPVDGQTLGQLLHDNGVPMLVLNACQSAMHEATGAPEEVRDVHDEIRAIGSLAQNVIDQGVPAVLGMRYSVYVVTAAQYIGQLYAALAKGRSFGQAATEGRKHLQLNPERWVGLRPRSLQDWFVPVVHEAAPIELFSPGQVRAEAKEELDPVQSNPALLRYVPEEGFIGRDETVLALDRAFDSHRVVLLHAYAGQGKSSTAVEFARWYSLTGGLGDHPLVLLASFESHTDLDDLLNQIGQPFAPYLELRGIHWNALNTPGERLLQVKRILREFPILWIWDNVEPVAGFPEGTESSWTGDEQNELRDFLKQIKLDTATKVRILLTSRRDEQKWLGGIAHRIAMSRMRNSDAAKLALQLGEEKNLKQSDIADWQPLLNYCAGNPLTLRVLASQAVRMNLHGEQAIEKFVEAIRDGEQRIEDADEKQGRDRSLGASLDYGFRSAFRDDELPIIALLHLFQGTVDGTVLQEIGVADDGLVELRGKTGEQITGLLERAKEIGLLTHLQGMWFTIHPALPWFLRQLFARHYDGRLGRSSSEAALSAWVWAVSGLSYRYHDIFHQGHREVIVLLELEEANILQARRLARRMKSWEPLIACMESLRALYEYRGRMAEWGRLVEEIILDYCTPENEPIADSELGYVLVMQYRVALSQYRERDLPKAVALQENLVNYCRSRAAAELALPPDWELDFDQRHWLRTLATVSAELGNLLRDSSDPACLTHYREAIDMFRRTGDQLGETITEYQLGHAFKDLPAVRDLDAAEAAYQRSLDLYAPSDDLGRSRCIKQIGMVYHMRFYEAREVEEPMETLRHYALAVEKRYVEALRLCPVAAVGDRAPMHGQLGNLYEDIGLIDKAREHYEQATQTFEKIGDHFNAGHIRLNMAIMYVRVSQVEGESFQRRANLLRARAYAEAALRDYRQYQGRAAAAEAKAESTLANITLLIDITQEIEHDS